MGFLKLFSKPVSVSLARLPAGSFTMDRDGRIVVSTLPSSFPVEILDDLGHAVLATFAEARQAGFQLDRVQLQYGSLKVSARDLAGGAIIFFSPLTPLSPNANN